MDLAAVIGPPPATPFPVDWGGVERRLGLRLPDDYKRFAETYGLVLVGEWIWVSVPHDCGRGGYFYELDQQHGLLRTLRAEDPTAHPFTFHPEAGGLLGWADSRGGEYYFWDTSASDDPNAWPTRIFLQGQDDQWRSADLPMTDVLAARVRGELGFGEVLPPVTSPKYGQFSPLVVTEKPASDEPVRDAPVWDETGPVALALETVGERSRVRPDGDLPPDYAALVGEFGVGRLGGVLRLLGPGAPPGFDRAAEEDVLSARLRSRRAAGERVVPSPVAPEPGGLRLWGMFDSGETAWWVPATRDPSGWAVVLVDADGLGWQRLPYRTTEFLDRWLDGRLDLPVLSLSAVARPRVLVPPGVEAPLAVPTEVERDSLAQLRTIIGEPQNGGHTYDWPAIESALGLRLPNDYKRLFETYGSIGINGLTITSPETLLEDQDVRRENMIQWVDESMLVYPDPGGILWCADTEGRDWIWWDTTDPDPDWWTMAWDVEFDHHTFAGSLTELVIADLTGILPDSLTGLDPSDDGPMMWF